MNEIPRDEFREYRCRTCDSVITNPDDRVYDGLGWAHFRCVDDFRDPTLAGERP